MIEERRRLMMLRQYKGPLMRGELESVNDAILCDVVFANNTDESLHIIRGESNWPSASNYTPIGIVVIPTNHWLLCNGDGSKNQCGIMSLNEMNYNNPEIGTTSNTRVPMYQGFAQTIQNLIAGKIISETSGDGLGRADGVKNVGTIYTTGNNYHPYIPGTHYSRTYTGSTPSDPVTRYYYNTSSYPISNYMYSPYDSLGNRLHRDEDGFHYINGISSCKLCIDKLSKYYYTNWKTSSTLSNVLADDFSTPICCCARYHTIGTKAFVDCTDDELYEGCNFWYLPSFGELIYVFVRLKEINSTLSKLKTKYNKGINIYTGDDYAYMTCNKNNGTTINGSSGSFTSYCFISIYPSTSSPTSYGASWLADSNIYLARAFMRLLDTDDSSIEEYEYVDLGLPSGKLWAKCNIGAKLETDFGRYFVSGNPAKYDKFGSYGSTNEATSIMGSPWRTPTKAEWEELINNTDITLSSDFNDSGVSGIIVTNRSDSSKYIFLPCNGLVYTSNSYISSRGAYCLYLTSTALSSNYIYVAYYSTLNNTFTIGSYSKLYYNYPIRAIRSQ